MSDWFEILFADNNTTQEEVNAALELGMLKEKARVAEVKARMAEEKARVASCPRCGGSGYLPQFRHVSGGACFACKR